MSKYDNMIGKKFGKLTVICWVGANKHSSLLWLCECECGNLHTAPTNRLRNGRTKSCGCGQIFFKYKKRNLIGRKFHELIVIARSPRKNNKHMWLCKCDCGELTTVAEVYLMNGKVKTCGCSKISQILIINGEKYKRCSKCKKVKKLKEFGKNKNVKSGIRSQCKKCVKEKYIQRHKKQKDKLTDWYIKSLILPGTSLSHKDIPQELIEIKRLQMQLKREVKNGKTEHQRT